MSTPFQALPQPGPPQLGSVYPTTSTARVGQDSSHSSSGSFGMVFVVLGVIVVVSAIACVAGRFCNKKSHKSREPKTHKRGHGNGISYNQNYPNEHNIYGGGYPRDPDLEFGFRSKEGDIMQGFEPNGRGLTGAKVANHGDFRGDGMGRGMEHGGEHGNFP